MANFRATVSDGYSNLVDVVSTSLIAGTEVSCAGAAMCVKTQQAWLNIR